MELLSLLVALMKAYLGVTLMLLPAASVATQLPLLFRLAQLIHHQESQLAQHLVDLIVLMEAVKMEPNTEQEHALEQIAAHIHKHSLEPVAQQLVVLGVLG